MSNHATRSKSSTVLIDKNKALQKLQPHSLTPKAKKPLISLPSKIIHTKALSSMPNTSRIQYVPSFLRSKSKNSRISLPLEEIISPYKKVIHVNLKKTTPQSARNLSQETPTFKKKFPKNFTIKLQKPVKEKLETYISETTFRTKVGKALKKNKPNNQDDCFIIRNFANSKDQCLLGVMDGHGLFGHQVSGFIKKHLPNLIENSLPANCNNYIVNESIIPPQLLPKLRYSISNSFTSIQRFFIENDLIDVNYSGSTAVAVYVKGKTCMCANVGDSRAIIGRFTEKWEVVELSYDHKPDNEYEKMRIESYGGRVEPYKEPNGKYIGPHRVWLKNVQIPGLAMSRSFGDLVAASVGVISDPDISLYNLTSKDKFILIASDGIWEYLSNQLCVDVVSKFYELGDIEKAADEIMKIAVNAWAEHDDVQDDITIVIAFLNVP